MIRIVSDGTPGGTQVLTESGEKIKGITEIEWSLKVGGLAEASFKVIMPSANVKFSCPFTAPEPKVDFYAEWIKEANDLAHQQAEQAYAEIDAGFDEIERKYARPDTTYISPTHSEVQRMAASLRRIINLGKGDISRNLNARTD